MPPTVDLRGLTELLAVALALSEIDRDKLAASGREWGRYLLGRPGTERADEQLPGVLAQLGFSADVHDDVARLRACPCPLVLPSCPSLICAIAGALVIGALAGAADGRRVVDRTNNHQKRRCTMTLAMAPDAP